MTWLIDPQIWISLITLTTLEIILGIDNILVISILTNKLPSHQQEKGRIIGLSLALFSRILLLLSLVWMTGLVRPLFSVFKFEVTIRDIVLFSGGLFLIYKATMEIHEALDHKKEEIVAKAKNTLASVVGQIILLDIVFSLDSVVTAVGMAQKVGVMIAAIIVAVIIMLIASGQISSYIHRHPSVKMLALNFLLLVGVTLVAEGVHFHFPKGYIYFAMGFSGLVEILNLKAGNRGMPEDQEDSGGFD
jgi:predicted tellurium resistance membrane protein TerC